MTYKPWDIVRTPKGAIAIIIETLINATAHPFGSNIEQGTKLFTRKRKR